MRFTYGLKQTINNFALDYEGSRFTQALADGQDRYLIFEGRLTGTKNHIDIPRGERFGGQHTDNLPCTLNGCIACYSDEILPEFEVNAKNQNPERGSVIWVIVKGKNKKVPYSIE